MATSIQGERVVPQSNNRRRGWVIASEDGTEIERPTSFDARKSAAAWNKGKGPSQASIPSRASSLASTPAPTPMLPSEPFQQADEPSASGPSTSEVITLPVPPPRIPSSSMSHSRDATSSTTSEAESSTGRRRPSPPLLVPPKQTFKKVPSKRVLPPSALSDHEKFMAAAYKGAGSSASSSSAGTSGSRSPFANAALRSDLAKLAASRRANSSSSSSTATTSTSASVSQSATALATSAVSATPTSNQLKGKAKQISQSPLQSDPEGFFSSGGKVKQMANTYDNTHSRQQSGDPQSSADASASSQQRSSDFTQHKQSLLLSQVHPLPALSEKSANSDIEDVPSSASDVMSDNEAAISAAAAKTVKRRESLQIELPPPPPQFKDRYPTILVDSTHASDSEASGTSNAGPRRRRRRSTASMSNKLGTDAEDDDDDEYAGDDSSWPSTPSTTPLETYFIAADAKPKPAKRTMQTTMEIVAAESSALGMGRPMVVVTSPSTASEVSSDRRSSSGSGSTSDRTYSSSPPAVASVAPPPALSKIEEHPSAKSDAAEASTAGPPKRSLSFEVPVMNRFRASEESLPIGGAVRSPSRAMAFLAKMNPSRSANRSSVDLVSTTRTDASSGTVQAAKRMSLDDQRRTSAEQRRSVELRPILLNAASRPPPRPVAIEAASSTTTSQQERRRSLGRAAVRSNVLPYHSRRSSEVSTSSSTDTPKAQDRGSFDKQPFDPGYSPTSQMTTFTMPSPALSTDQKLFSNQPAIHAQQSTETNQRRSSAAGAPRDRFAASMPSLHQPVVHAQPRDRRTASNEEPGAQPSAIRLLIDSQKGRTTRDNDSIAEWISVSVNDLLLPDVTEAYGNGGAGEFSNENQHHGKKPKKNKPWKLGRFAASEVVLPSSSAVQAKRRSISLVKRSSSAQVNEPTRVSAESTSSPPSAPFMRNLGFTTANRNVALQNLCAERSVMALAASTIYIAGCGRIKVPQPAALPAAKSKAKSKTQEAENKKLGQVSTESTAVAVVEGPSSPVHPSHSADASQDAYLNVTEDRHTGYDLSGAAVGTVKSMVPELGDWSGSMEHDRSHSEEVAEPERPFRDYDDEGSDLFDSDRSDTESEDEFDYGEEDVEVPVRFGQRVNVSSRAGSAFYGSSVPTGYEAERSVDEATPPARHLVPSVSLDRLTPGTVMVHGTELRICVEEEQLSGRSARPMAYWKAVEVQQPESKPEEPVENQIRRQPSNRAMKLEEEVATGIFAAFVGNRSPRRQNQRASIDAGPCSADQGSPQKRSTQSTSISRRELVVSKVNKSTFTVRSETRSTMDGTEQVVEILRRGGSQSTHLTQASESSRGSTSTDKVERAFPSPLLSNTEFANSRPRSHNRTNGSLSTLEDVAERITIRIQQQGVSGFSASFQSRDGQVWLWQGSKLEASVLSPRKTQAGVHGIDVLDNYDLVLRARNGSQSIELATYSTDSQLRNALGLFKPRTKPVPKALPEDTSNLGSAVAPPTRVLPLAIPIRGMAGGISRGEPQIPLRGIRGGPLLRPQTSANGSALRQHGLWQQQRAAVSTEAVVQVHNNAVNNARASVQLNERLASKRASTDTARPSPQDEGTQDQKMGVLSFAAVEALDRDLVVLSLLAVMGSVRM
ncbi:hypothetical protein PHSY_003704 [Pseudozyma hubeiensis SY62]|uniref:Uncharacterized protein n=1 Tax=Pseudozyma hubeiensis (strain SY62) TaxID=1305764 RepID=R9P492_PSEHS|nr:hypothetical protein PHSY_003704 [Pseudozyma hubeiensis SY62]GAC96124.1 hypothetical protein PHSY_003704 [Pseudozyma hubeiensis SY62]